MPFDVALRDPALRLLPEKTPRSVIVVAIDEASLQREGAWPWSRTRLASLINASAGAGARAVAIDILLPESRDGDAALAAALRNVPSVAAAALDEKARWILPAPSLRDATSAAHASFELDHDGVLRRVAATKQSDALVLPALPVHLASTTTRRPVPTGRTLAPAFRVPPRGVAVVSGTDVLRRDPATLRRLRGRIVLIGLTAFALGDRVVTPRSLHSADPGVLVHAAATESFIAGDVLHDVPPWAAGIITALLAWSALSLGRFAAFARIPAAGAVVIAPLAGTFALALINVVIPAATMAATVAMVVLTDEALRIGALARHGRAAAAAMQANLGIRGGAFLDAEIGPRLEELATAIARRRAEEVESKRILAHELKTPLAAMRSLTQVLAGFDLSDEERRRMATLLGSEAGKLQSMVGGLLERGRIKAIFDKISGDEPRAVKTPGALLAVRGTRYGVEVGRDGRAMLVVFEGAVEVISPLRPQPLLVRAGEMCEFGRTHAPMSMPMPHGMNEHTWGQHGMGGSMHDGGGSMDGSMGGHGSTGGHSGRGSSGRDH